MKAAIVSKSSPNKVVVVDKKLRPIKAHEALLDIECCGVCHTDLHVSNGDFGDVEGRVLGHEGIGIVSQIGAEVDNLKIGDRVAVAWFYEGCGTCEYCISGRETFCLNAKNAGYSVDGAMAEQCIVPAKYTVKVPDGLGSAEASSVTCAGVTCYKAVKVSHVRPGQYLAVYGVGGLGNLAVQYAKNVFNCKVIAVDVDDAKLKLAKKIGADLTFNSKTGNSSAWIKEKTDGGAHGAVVTATSKTAFNEAINCVRRAARVVAIGLPPETMDLSIVKTVLEGIEVVGSLVGTREDLAESLQFAAEGKVKPVVTMRPLDEVGDVFREMLNGQILGRMVLQMHPHHHHHPH